MTISSPLRLAVGSHRAGSGKGCAMNVISWENGDQMITDMPACADPLLARVVQRVNDWICTHRDRDLLCPTCSLLVLNLAHRTAGTALTDWDDDRRGRIYVRLALDEAVSIARPEEDERVTRCRHVVQQWLDGTATRNDVWKARAVGAADVAAAAAANAADATYAADGADGAAFHAYAAHHAVYAASRLDWAHHFIDRFETLTGVRALANDTNATAAAIRNMNRCNA